MKVLITGATGLIGKQLVPLLLKNNIDVHYLSTSHNKLSSINGSLGFYWNPDKEVIDEKAFAGVDAIIHLAGASISKRWTKSYKEEIIISRVKSAELLFTSLQKFPNQVSQFVSASAIGIYPDSLTKIYNEDSPETDSGFLGRVVTKWEQSADKFALGGIKVCKLRTGLVLSTKGGALPEIAKPINFGLGSPFGSGLQIQSWIHIKDLVSMYLFALENSLEGVYNAAAPNPVTNWEMTKAIARILGKPLFMPAIPRWLMKLALGEMHQLLFTGQNVNPAKIMSLGFKFEFTVIDKALRNLYGK
jgi:uncharacterized protein